MPRPPGDLVRGQNTLIFAEDRHFYQTTRTGRKCSKCNETQARAKTGPKYPDDEEACTVKTGE